jgi:hypothetical protein
MRAFFETRGFRIRGALFFTLTLGDKGDIIDVLRIPRRDSEGYLHWRLRLAHWLGREGETQRYVSIWLGKEIIKGTYLQETSSPPGGGAPHPILRPRQNKQARLDLEYERSRLEEGWAASFGSIGVSISSDFSSADGFGSKKAVMRVVVVEGGGGG